MILLVHGYNVDEEVAQKGYNQFRDHLRVLGSHILADKLGEVYWPADERWKLISTLRFSNKVPRARQVGRLFAEYLVSRKQPRQLVLIAHSLGCRMVLETLRILAERRSRPQVKLFLMAAGVPVPMVEPEGRLRKAAESAIEKYAYYSKSDEALFVFPAGQWLADDGGLRNFEAVGRYGKPVQGLWTGSQDMEKGFRHGHYWEKDKAAQSIARHLDRAAPKDIGARTQAARQAALVRKLPLWSLPFWRKTARRNTP